MKVSYEFKKGLLKFRFTLEDNEGIDYTGKVKMGRYQCEMHMPDDWSLENIHPDVLALVAILISYPFMDKYIEVPIGVSTSFHKLFNLETQKFIYPIDKKLSPRTAPKDSIPGLAYSGGIDSTAALLILPRNTACFFLDRILPRELEGENLYDKQSVYEAYDYLRKEGRQEYTIKTDLEYIRFPRGFPIEFSTTIPALLLSDYVGIDSVATGTIMEHQFLEYQRRKFSSRHYFVKWNNIFKGVDIFLNQVTAGISEIGTMKMVLNSPYNSIANWCMKGTIPCMKCGKCFRKKLIQMILLKQQISNDILDDFFLATEIRTLIKKFPINAENIITYITSNYSGNHKLMNLLKIRTRGDILETNWMEKWYVPSKDLILDKYSDYVEREIGKYLEFMDGKDELNMNNWSVDEVIESQIYQEYQERFISELIKHKEVVKARNRG